MAYISKVLAVALASSVDARRRYDSNRTTQTRMAIPSDKDTEIFANTTYMEREHKKSPLVGADTIGTPCP